MLIAIVFFFVVNALAPSLSAPEYRASQEDLPAASPKFDHYQVRTIFRGKPASAVINTAKARQFRTRLSEDSRLGPNFAGHYTVVFWGCGSGCAQLAVVNAISGRVTWLPQDWIDIPDGHNHVQTNRNYRINSRLLVVAKSHYDARASFTAYFYLMSKDRLHLIKQLESDHSQ